MSSSEDDDVKNTEYKASKSSIETTENIISDKKNSKSPRIFRNKNSIKIKHKNNKVKKPKLFKMNKITVNLCSTQYSVVEAVMRKLNYKITRDPGADFDLFWADTGVTSDKLAAIRPYQKINHYPAMTCISRKDQLGRNLNKMKSIVPNAFDFFPQTWILPMDFPSFKSEFGPKKKRKTFIMKPWDSCQGKGIFLTKSYENLSRTERYIAQRYIRRPYLIENLKFDLRIYCLIYGCDPLRIFIYKEGMSRFATDNYNVPNDKNLNDQYIHLTNYAINKNNKKFIFNTDAENPNIGHKKSLSFIWQYIDEHGGDSTKLKSEIYDCIVKTLCMVQPILSQSYYNCIPMDIDNNRCFEILGFDILIDDKLRPWILEVNNSPSFTTDTPFDLKLKSSLIEDTVKLLNLSESTKLKLDKLSNLVGKNEKLTKIEIKPDIKKQKINRMKKRDEFEKNNLGGFEIAFPSFNQSKYEDIINIAYKVFFGSNTNHLSNKRAPLIASFDKQLIIKINDCTSITSKNIISISKETSNSKKHPILSLPKINSGSNPYSNRKTLIPNCINICDRSLSNSMDKFSRRNFNNIRMALQDSNYEGEEEAKIDRTTIQKINSPKIEMNKKSNSRYKETAEIISKLNYLRTYKVALSPLASSINYYRLERKPGFLVINQNSSDMPTTNNNNTNNNNNRKNIPNDKIYLENRRRNPSTNIDKKILNSFQNIIFQGFHFNNFGNRAHNNFNMSIGPSPGKYIVPTVMNFYSNKFSALPQ